MKQMDTMLFQQSQRIDDIKNRLNCIESGSGLLSGFSGLSESELDLEQIKPALMADTDFVSGIVDNIMNNSNLSEIIEQIDAVQTETRELRELLHVQQKTINEMNIMLLKVFSQSLNQPAAPIASIVPIAPTEPAITAPEVEMEVEVKVGAVIAQEGTHEINDDDTPIKLEVLESPSNMQTVD